MKVVHLNKEKVKPVDDLSIEAKELESIIADNPSNNKALNRLMLI